MSTPKDPVDVREWLDRALEDAIDRAVRVVNALRPIIEDRLGDG